jgi:5-formyltetrahydrofolate cyclo-ligase
MEAVPLAPDAPLGPDAFGLPCPQGPAFREDPDLVLVPCVSATRHGARLGRGAGCYDRYLARHPGTGICLCFEPLLSDALPEGPWDIRIPLVLTEKGFSVAEPRQDSPA